MPKFAYHQFSAPSQVVRARLFESITPPDEGDYPKKVAEAYQTMYASHSGEVPSEGSKNAYKDQIVAMKNGGQVLLFDILISRDERRCSSDLIIDFGLTPNELRYILDPKDVYGPDFPGETFRVLKEKEEKQYGKYRTRRLVLEAWDRIER